MNPPPSDMKSGMKLTILTSSLSMVPVQVRSLVSSSAQPVSFKILGLVQHGNRSDFAERLAATQKVI